MSTSKVQSRRFEASLGSAIVDEQMFLELKSNSLISFFKWSEKAIYIETACKKTVSFFSKGVFPSRMENIVTTSVCRISDEEVIGIHGKPMDTRQIKKSAKVLTGAEKLKALYNSVRQNKVAPDLRDDVEAMINKRDYDKVITMAKKRNLAESYNMTPLPWQKMALEKILNQNDRELLWIFDFNGNSGKTELGKFLRYKQDFQRLATGMFSSCLDYVLRIDVFKKVVNKFFLFDF